MFVFIFHFFCAAKTQTSTFGGHIQERGLALIQVTTVPCTASMSTASQLGMKSRKNIFDILPRFYDDPRLVSGAADEKVKVWDVETGKELFSYAPMKTPIRGKSFFIDTS